MLTDEQIRNILGMHGALPLKDGAPDSIIEGREAVLILAIRAILAAHSANPKGMTDEQREALEYAVYALKQMTSVQADDALEVIGALLKNGE